MNKKINYFDKIIKLFEEIQSICPSYNIGKHLSTITNENGDLWGIDNKDLYFILCQYRDRLELDAPRGTPDEEIEKIIKDGINLNLDTEDYG